MQSYWFGEVDENGCTPCRGGPEILAKRLETIKISPGRFIPFDWRNAGNCSFTPDRGEYIRKLRELCFYLAEAAITRQYESRDAELLQMVRTLDQMDDVSNVLTERALEWHRITNPGFSRKYMRLPKQKLLPMMKRGGSPAFRQVINEIENLASARTALMKEVSRRADEVVPNCSALLGGLVAARLVSQAGSLSTLSRLPGSSIQVLGARTALFSHMRGGTPPPKHGIIFQHRRVHNAPKEVRGKVARVLAAKLAIAARLDQYRQEAAPEFIEAAQAAIDNAGRTQT
ncbi:MAG: RNA-processing protein [Methanomicrobiales archaeon]